ncbi:hypothetical protein KABACHOK_02090 [Brevundimonas phage vB_BpoS-Kabachok]|uniref:Uncharacterized protein n=1 Tax=Brevundimonas phage vB_BpoS-Kabachok TaxID=2948600 RepID=A0A9E7MQ21_9CAUD|nr:hypothetical protein KABACHOK_02090 [Brevundimonas phage vB_BpoS-Kabachok]
MTGDARPRKRKVETYQVDGVDVVFTQVDPDLGISFNTELTPQQRSKWEITVGEDLVGFAFYPIGVGKPWVFTALVPNGCTQTYSDSFVHAWEPPPPNPECGNLPVWGRYSGLMGKLTPLTPWRQDVEPDTDHGRWGDSEVSDWRGWKSREHMASFVPRFLKAGRLPNPAAVVKIIADAKQARIDSAERARAKALQDKADREERDRIHALEAAARKQLQADTLEGLRSIQDRLGQDLSNFEAAALAEAIKKAGG